MKMDGEIDANVSLDYIEFQLFPSQNRYEACVCWENRKEKVTSGPLAQLFRHSDKIKSVQTTGSNVIFKLDPPQDLGNANWFAKSTLLRFLHIIASPNIPNTTNAIVNEISQLEESRKFHLSLHDKAKNDTTSSDPSKNELLRAIDLRLTALQTDLANSLEKAAGSTCSTDETIDLEKFSQYFGATELRKTLRKYIEMNEETKPVNSENYETVKEIKQIQESSPAKAAQIERQSSSESEELSYSSDEDQELEERSRTLKRSASPRRSSSPMRRVQIGRSGSRRSTPLTIKSLSYFPARVSHNNTEEEGSEEQSRKLHNDIKRMSVLDAVKLFENKQKEQSIDLQKGVASLNPSVNTNKSVLRRWSSGMGESSVKKSDPSESKEVETNLKEEITEPLEKEEVNKKLTASAEWGRQKEAELNQMLMEMKETKPVKYRNTSPELIKKEKEKLPNEQRGGFYDHYKEKRDMKLRSETDGKRAEKEKQLKAMQQILDEGKASIMASKVSRNAKVPQKVVKDALKPKAETIKPVTVKKSSQKESSLPVIRKSWSSTPSPRGISSSPSGPTNTRRKSQPPPLASTKSTPKIEGPKLRQKPVKTSPSEVKTIKRVSEKTKTKPSVINPTPLAKPSLYNKVPKKSSVVPLESKPFLRRGSGGVKTKLPGPTIKPEDPVPPKENSIIHDNKEDKDVETLEVQELTNLETELNGSPIHEKAEIETETFNEVTPQKMENKVEEEIIISSAAWEIEEQEYDNEPVPILIQCDESPIKLVSVKVTSPRVRHSLSQMMLDEPSESDVIEWGNAENPPSLIYQKESPKGLKRLLKFARKSKTDANSSGWSSSSAVSEGEDDSEESKTLHKKDAENLLKKATLRAQYDEQQKNLLQGNTSKTIAQTLSEKLREGNASASVTTNKASRSFFSLSAFKGRKQNETKL